MPPRHTAHVTSARDLSPGIRRVEVSGADLSSWTSSGHADEYVIVQVPDAATTPGWEEAPASGRFYTVRRWDPATATMTLDVVVHADGHGSDWARRCHPGSPVAVGAPRGHWDPPADTTHRLLLADATGLPAVARILEEAGPDESFDVVVEVGDPADMLDLPSAADVTIEWRVSGNGRTPSTLLEAMSARPAPTLDTWTWVACEASVSRRCRTFLRAAWPRPVSHYRIVGYWHQDQARLEERWAALTPEQLARSRDLWDPDEHDEVNWIAYEQFLQEVGL